MSIRLLTAFLALLALSACGSDSTEVADGAQGEALTCPDVRLTSGGYGVAKEITVTEVSCVQARDLIGSLQAENVGDAGQTVTIGSFSCVRVAEPSGPGAQELRQTCTDDGKMFSVLFAEHRSVVSK